MVPRMSVYASITSDTETKKIYITYPETKLSGAIICLWSISYLLYDGKQQNYC